MSATVARLVNWKALYEMSADAVSEALYVISLVFSWIRLGRGGTGVSELHKYVSVKGRPARRF